MINDMTYSEINTIKQNIKSFIIKIFDLAKENNRIVDKNEEEFFIYLSKHIVFFKYLYLGLGKNYFYKVIISDIYNFMFSIIKNDIRYIYVNERSIIENYIRAIMRKTIEDDHVTNKLFLDMKAKNFLFNFTEDDYSLIKSQYSTACNYIHGGEALDHCLVYFFNDCLFDKKEIAEKHKYYQRIRNILKIFDKMLISEYGKNISSCFHRQKSVFEYLLGKDCLELLFNVT